MKTLIYVKAPNDVNGNPRRGWIVTWMDNLFVDEGYMGRDALYTALGMPWSDQSQSTRRYELDSVANEITLHVPVRTYKNLKRGK